MFCGAYGTFSSGDESSGFIFLTIGIALLIIGYNKNSNMVVGGCPYCGYKIRTSKHRINTRCPACRKLLVIRDNKFIGIE